MESTHPYKLFLLGGYDLEMLTIRQLLEGRNDCVIADKHLRWDNAKLSTYQEELSKHTDNIIYGIELQEDITTPPNYHRIDHHNDKCSNPSSLEQVASLLGTELNRRQRLIAANDAGYIPAMQALNASEEEIAEIRRMDRAAQGVTEEDERLAELSISEHLTRYDGLYIVNAQTSKFSSICDRLYPYQRLLIYTDVEWTYYGGKSDMVAMLKKDIYNNKVYHGGGENGYVGAAKGAFTTEQILDFVTLIKRRYERN